MLYTISYHLGAMAVPLLLLLLEVLAALVLLGGFFRLHRENRRDRRAWEDERNYYEMVSRCAGEAQLLMRRSDQYPCFATENFEKLFGLSPDCLREDLNLAEAVCGRTWFRDFTAQYNAWDGTGPLVTELELSGPEGARVFRLCITRSPDLRYDFFDLIDISKEKQTIRELEDGLEKSREESRSKTTFLSRMSHEIRTPMNGIIGMLTLAQTQLAGHPAMQYLDKAETLSQLLLSLINDILDMSRIEAGKMELESKPFDLYTLAEKLRSMFQKNIEAKGVRFELEMTDLTVHCLIGDELRISQVLVNFLSNAMKFTESGEIRVTFRQMLLEKEHMDLMIRVHDTGRGIEPDFLNRIFRPFEQESTQVTKKYGGSGLGLAISDQIVRLMGGEIVIDSMPGRGSDFTLYLHLPYVDDSMEEQTDTASEPEDVSGYTYEGLHILMAEDNEINAEIAVSILDMEGASVEVAENGQAAISKFASSAPGTYNLILMDIQMPVMNGRDAAKAIRAMERPDAKTIPIFALSADAFVEDQRMSIEAGMDGHFSKPINFEEMKIGIGRVLKERRR